MMINGWSVLLVYAAGGLLALVLTGLRLFVIVRAGVLGAMKAHTRWVDDGKR